MSLTAYNFQFYSYNMPTRRYGDDENNMDVDDIDMSIPPPKPPRAPAIYNNNNVFTATGTPLQPLITSTSNSTTPSTTPAADISGVSYLPVPNETPKSIYSSGLPNGVNTSSDPVKLQLRPNLHVTQNRLSFEFREKLLEISKRSSAISDEENFKTTNHLPIQTEKQEVQIKPQHHSGCKSLSSEIRQKALEMSKRNSGSFETESAITAMQPIAINATNQKNSFTFRTTIINAYEKANLNNNETDNPAPAGGFFGRPKQAHDVHLTAPTEDTIQTVKDRICFFNKLANTRSNSFMDLLKNSKSSTLATTQHSSSAQRSPLPTPLKPGKLSTYLEPNLQQNCSAASIQLSHIKSNLGKFFPPTSSNKDEAIIKKSPPPSVSSTGTSSNSTQRKNSLRRRISTEKSRRPIVRQNSTYNSKGTKPQMHSVMEDLNLVMPVKLRIAEYERRINMKW